MTSPVYCGYGVWGLPALALLSVGLVLGALWGALWSQHVALNWLLAGWALLGVWALWVCRPRVVILALLLLALTLGLRLGLLRKPADFAVLRIPALKNQSAVLVGRVGKRQHAVMQLTSGSWGGQRVLLESPLDSKILEGQRVLLNGLCREPRVPAFEGGFNEALYWQANHWQAACKGVVRLLPSRFNWFAQQRQILSTQLHQFLPEHLARLLGSMVLGQLAVPVSAETKQSFIETGLIHLLAASGFNVGIVAAGLWLLARWCKLPRLLGLALAMIGIVFYMQLAGASPSVLRSGTMLLLAFAIKAIWPPIAPLWLLMIVVTALLLWDPLLGAQLGFLLSVSSTFGLMVMAPVVVAALRHWGWPSFWAQAVAIPFVAQCWVWPLSFWAFQQLSPWAVLLNVAAGLLVVPITFGGFVVCTLLLLGGQQVQIVANGLLYALKPLLVLLVALANFGQQLPWHYLTVAAPSKVVVVLAYGVLLLWGILDAKAKLWRLGLTYGGLLFVLLLWWAMAVWPNPAGTWLSFRANDVYIDAGGRLYTATGSLSALKWYETRQIKALLRYQGRSPQQIAEALSHSRRLGTALVQ